MRQLGVGEALRQFIVGEDFQSPKRTLSDLTPEQATQVPQGCPYSIATQVAHMLFWQDRWLGIARGTPVERRRGRLADWPRPRPEEWDSIRSQFLFGLQSALEAASSDADLNRTTRTGTPAEKLLAQIAVHNAYHLGQIVLLRQLLGCGPWG